MPKEESAYGYITVLYEISKLHCILRYWLYIFSIVKTSRPSTSEK